MERFAAVLQERVDAAHAALNGQLRRVSDWTSRATDLSDELSRALRGTRSWPTAQEWSALQSRVALLLSAQPTRAEAEGLEFDIQVRHPVLRGGQSPSASAQLPTGKALLTSSMS